MRLLGISGSLRAGSHNTALLRAASGLAPQGIELELYDGLETLPHYNEDRDTDRPPASAVRLRELVAGSSGLLIATPEYNGTIPGALKSAIDWASRPRGPEAALLGKPVAVIGASASEYGAIWAQDHLRKALAIAGARVLDVELAVGKAATIFDPHGELADAGIAERLRGVLEALAEHHHSLALAA